MWALLMSVDRHETPDVYLFETEEQAVEAYRESLEEFFEGEEFDLDKEYWDDDLVWIVETKEKVQ